MPPMNLATMQRLVETGYNTWGATPHQPYVGTTRGGGYAPGSYPTEALPPSLQPQPVEGVAQQGTKTPLPTESISTFQYAGRGQSTTGTVSLPSAISNPWEAAFSSVPVASQPAPTPTAPSNVSYEMELYLLSLRLSVLRQLCSDFCRAHEKWRAAAYLQGVTINGAIAAGGSAAGPDLGVLMRSLVPAQQFGGGLPYLDRLRNAASVSLSNAWRKFERSITVPGLPWYPTFTRAPGPVAPVTPNEPCPLSALTSGSVLVVSEVAAGMKTAFGTPEQYSNRMLDSLAFAFVTTVRAWIKYQKVVNVLGTGPVPATAVSRVGPVVGGMVIPNPGVFMDPLPGTGPIVPPWG